MQLRGCKKLLDSADSAKYNPDVVIEDYEANGLRKEDSYAAYKYIFKR